MLSFNPSNQARDRIGRFAPSPRSELPTVDIAQQRPFEPSAHNLPREATGAPDCEAYCPDCDTCLDCFEDGDAACDLCLHVVGMRYLDDESDALRNQR